ncbi:hypothetical protein bpr_I0332 [Butyrivibrio proteoclasticus B316]|uniref:Uncharacterized protein n=1 Tax=Butyrivibrio proteoclasticus (strain ATCC 51982 / DSM 14932 / B316) TaxID=515622 RepID=E0RYJ9_BUTPB|nr:hypothetical protein [Butyrivibrio proteoclasticus]ADL33080.1 hypothetical protein bpr_I0332 [Butyrivibrio proteoclasticus B316]
MGISIGSIGSPYGMSFVKPMNYTIKNQSEVSDEFTNHGAKGLVPNVTPVGYPNAQAVSTVEDDEEDPMQMAIDMVKKSQEAGKMYNDVAQKFQGMTVGYSQNQGALSYGISGGNLDLFA